MVSLGPHGKPLVIQSTSRKTQKLQEMTKPLGWLLHNDPALLPLKQILHALFHGNAPRTLKTSPSNIAFHQRLHGNICNYLN